MEETHDEHNGESVLLDSEAFLEPSDRNVLGNTWLVQVGAILCVACWAMAGTTLRFTLGRVLVRYGFLPTYKTFTMNCIGSYLLGFIGTLVPVTIQTTVFPWIFSSLLVGFCGSFATFSGWMLDIVGQNTAGRAIGELISGITMPFVFFIWGRDSGLLVQWLVPAAVRRTTRGRGTRGGAGGLRKLHIANIIYLVMSIIAAVVIPIAVEVAVRRGHVDVDFIGRRAVVVSPLGAVPRFVVGQLVNGRKKFREFPVGTLIVNVTSTLIVSILDHFHRISAECWSMIMMEGICGALSTVPTYVLEVVAIYGRGKRGLAYVYATVSVVLGCTIVAITRHVPW